MWTSLSINIVLIEIPPVCAETATDRFDINNLSNMLFSAIVCLYESTVLYEFQNHLEKSEMTFLSIKADIVVD